MLTLIALSAVLMQDPPPPAPEVHARVMVLGSQGPGSLDKDGDGQVSREEFSAPMDDHFARIDKDGDGRLSTGELSAGHGGDMTFIHGGPPGEPGVRRFELRRPRSAGEPGAGEEREIVIRSGADHGMPMVIHGMGHDGPGGETRVEVRQIGGPGGRAEMDKDGDGKVSEAEFIAPLRDAFARMDADRSGFIEDGERGAGGDVRIFTHRIETRDED